ncbi:MAG: DUF2285 domain-containing protein [Rhizomicrobium sp.]
MLIATLGGTAPEAAMPQRCFGTSALFVDPSLNTRFASVFWSPDVSQFALATTSSPPWPGGHAKPFDRRELRCDMQLLTLTPGREQACFSTAAAVFRSPSQARPWDRRVCLSPIAAQRGIGTTRRAELVRALDHLVAHGGLPARVHRADAGAYRLLFILLALDSARTEAAPRETARVLFGEARVRDHWRSDGRAMRAQIHRAIERGNWLTAGGYRTLLR